MSIAHMLLNHSGLLLTTPNDIDIEAISIVE